MRKLSFVGLTCILAMVVMTGTLWAAEEDKQKTPEQEFREVGQLSIAMDIPGIETDAFICKPVAELKKGDKLAALVSKDQAWSMRKYSVEISNREFDYPVFGMAKDKKGQFHVLIAGTATFKEDITVNKVVTSGNFSITASRPVKSGETIPVVMIGIEEVILSIECLAHADGEDGQQSPWLKIFKTALKPVDTDTAVEIWKQYRP